MLAFFTDCAGLFNRIFYAANALAFFRFLSAFLVLGVCLGLFLRLYRGVRRL